MRTDPYKYFRIEARELVEGLSGGVLELEKGNVDKDRVARLLRLAHTLKGAARVVKQPAIAELAHAVEEALAPYRDGPGAVANHCTDRVLRCLDGMAKHLAALEPAAEERRQAAPHSVGEEPFETVRVEIGEMDALLEGTSQVSVRLAALSEDVEELARARRAAAMLVDQLHAGRLEGNGGGPQPAVCKARSLAEELSSSLETLRHNLAMRIDEAQREVQQLRDRANRTRLVPASAVFGVLRRAVRDAAQALHKRVDFEASGGENRLDAHVLGALRDALLHVVRNSVAHGIEAEPDRLLAGKPHTGRVELRVERRGNRLAFVCRDDGAGIDVEAVRRAAVQRGLLSASESQALGFGEVVRLILQGGVTTTGAVTEVSGRGIGLDVLRETVARLKGDVNVLTQPGHGTTVEVCVPVSLSSLAALVVDASGIALLPLDAVRQTLRVLENDIARSAEGDSMLHEGKPIPFLPLVAALRRQVPPGSDRRARSAVVVASRCGLVAVGVDRLLGITNVVVRPLPPLVAADPVVACASIDAYGSPQLMLDPAGLVAAAAAGRTPAGATAVPARQAVLIIDDSLTTRMLEQSILESAGYDVDLASSAEEALRRAQARRYRLFLVDVEMPGMDGFEFVARTRADPVLREVPSVLVTSRSSVEDRRRGEHVGARAYIVKSEFDQEQLLHTIRELTG